ncbi:MAG: CoA transferase, partial [Actinomycetota bacterium]|nr:CoA transferase [Actinomycetota bacterium]
MDLVGDPSPVTEPSTGTTGLDSHCASETLALGAVAFCATQGARWTGQPLAVDPGRVGASFRSFTHLRLGGEGFTGFDALSGFFEAGDGWVRTHANYPWHRERLCRVLGLDESADQRGVAEAIRSWPAQALEDAVTQAGGIAVRVRTEAEYAALLPAAPLLEVTSGARRRELRDRPVRVLDLTRVIAGPVATRTLAALGMDVLRIDPPALPEPIGQFLDSAAGKRSAIVDLAAAPDLVERLVGAADVVVLGYRPGSLHRVGLDPDDLFRRHPDTVVATLQAWPPGSPWQGRRGFDSIVQAASGIAVRESTADGRPGALSTQALDHSCGYLLAGAVLHALASGRGARVTTSLAAAGQALLALGPAEPAESRPDDSPHVETVGTPLGELIRVRSLWELPAVDRSVVAMGS